MRIKNCNYVLGKKVWLNKKYIKTKRNQKLESKFFRPFQIFYTVEKQAYKLKLLTKWKIHNVFYVSLPEQDIISKSRINKTLLELKKDLEFEAGDNKEYEVETICNSIVYSSQANNNNQILGFYYLVL